MRELHLGRNLLDHQLLDREGRRCGNVDDLAIEGGPGERAMVVALLVGPGYWPNRSRRIGRLAGWLGGSKRTRVPWQEVTAVDSGVRLRGRATDLGLGTLDDRLRPLLERIPGAHR
jgi:sporulation protein YlmC with PRC-barrel domain